MTQVLKFYPPHFPMILKAFPWVKGRKTVVYAYKDKIFNPGGLELPPWIIEHEKVHLKQQEAEGPDAWWKRYCSDPKFRMSQEIPAHIREWEVFRQHHDNATQNERYLTEIAARLSGPLYNRMIGPLEAMHLIRNEVIA